jgi:glycosyltransferase involved in cell wall biosynthesis
VAVTLEQCWHDVPGGTASSALGSLRAQLAHTSDELVGVSAWHRAQPPAPWVPPIPVRPLRLPRPLLYESWHRLRWPSVERATGRVDVIHVTGMAMPPKTAPMVVTVHDLAFVHDPGHFTPHGVRFFERAIELARLDADVVVCPSRATRDDCVAHGFEPGRVRVVPWGVDATPATAADLARVRAGFGLDRPYVLWLGTIEPRKNVPTLLDAFARLSRADRADVDLVIAGGAGWNDELAAIEARLAERGDGRVRRIGFVPPDDLPALYAGALVFCFPSEREGFGMPVLEAMAQGTPVITSAGTATAEVVGDRDREPAGVLVDPHDVDALAAALRELIEDPERAAALGEAGRTRAATYTWRRTALDLEAAYTAALDRSGRSVTTNEPPR